MSFVIYRTEQAQADFDSVRNDPSLEKRFKAVSKCIRFLAENPRHPGLQTHKFDSLHGPNGEEVFEAYAENKTSGAYRVFWYYGPGKNVITIIAITPHP